MPRDARFVTPHERLVYLRSLPQFAQLLPEELAAYAEAARERYFRRGAKLAEEGSPTRHVYLVIDGEVSVRRRGLEILRITPPGAVGVLTLLAEDPNGSELRAEAPTLTLELDARLIRDSLDDSFDLFQSSLRQLNKQLLEMQAALERVGQLKRDPPTRGVAMPHEMDLVDRLAALTQRGPFQHVSLDALSEIALHLTEARYQAGEPLWKEGDPSKRGALLISGVVLCTSTDGRRFRLGAGSSIGHLEAFAQVPRSYTAVAETALFLLKDDVETLFDVLEDNPRAGWHVVSFFARQVLELAERRARLVTPLAAARTDAHRAA